MIERNVSEMERRWSMLKNMRFSTFSMDSRVSVYFSSVCLISARQQLRTSTSACVWKHKPLWWGDPFPERPRSHRERNKKSPRSFSIETAPITFTLFTQNIPSSVCVCDSYQHQRRWLLSPHQVFIYASTRAVVLQSVDNGVQVVLVFGGVLAVKNGQEHTANESCIMTTAGDFVRVTIIIQINDWRWVQMISLLNLYRKNFRTSRFGRTWVVVQTLMKISSPCIAFIALKRHFTSSLSFHQHSAEMCTITHPPPLTLTEEPRRRFYQNNLWASGPPGEQGWRSAVLKKKSHHGLSAAVAGPTRSPRTYSIKSSRWL